MLIFLILIPDQELYIKKELDCLLLVLFPTEITSLYVSINVKGLKIDKNGQFTKRFPGLAKLVIR